MQCVVQIGRKRNKGHFKVDRLLSHAFGPDEIHLICFKKSEMVFEMYFVTSARLRIGFAVRLRIVTVGSLIYGIAGRLMFGIPRMLRYLQFRKHF